MGGEDVQRHKPDPSVFLQVFDLLKLEPSDCIYIGDNIIDAQAAERARVDFIAVLTGVTSLEEFYKYPKIKVISSLSELRTVI